MNVNIDEVVDAMANQIASLTKDNIVLRVLVKQLESELNLANASQVKEKGSRVQTQASAS